MEILAYKAVITIVGPPASGKTTAAKALAALAREMGVPAVALVPEVRAVDWGVQPRAARLDVVQAAQEIADVLVALDTRERRSAELLKPRMISFLASLGTEEPKIAPSSLKNAWEFYADAYLHPIISLHQEGAFIEPGVYTYSTPPQLVLLLAHAMRRSFLTIIDDALLLSNIDSRGIGVLRSRIHGVWCIHQLPEFEDPGTWPHFKMFMPRSHVKFNPTRDVVYYGFQGRIIKILPKEIEKAAKRFTF